LNTYRSLLRVDVKSAKNLKDTDLAGKSDPYAVISFKDREAAPKSSRTVTIKESLNPIWNTTFFFLVSDDCKHFKVELFDEDFGRDDSLGHCNVLRKDPGERTTYSGEEYYLEKGKGGTIDISTQEISITSGLDYLLGTRKAAIEKFIASKQRPPLALLEVVIHHCEGLKSGWIDKSDPYVKIQFEHEPEGASVMPKDLKTRTIDNNPSPIFEEKFHFMIPDSLKSMRLSVWDEDPGRDDALGHCTVMLKDYMQKEDRKKYALNLKGTITVSYVRIPLPPLFFD